MLSTTSFALMHVPAKKIKVAISDFVVNSAIHYRDGYFPENCENEFDLFLLICWYMDFCVWVLLTHV